jgi:uncharacterized protein (DUF2141 family)
MWSILWVGGAQAQTLSVDVSGLRAGGSVRAGAYADADTWLSDEGAVASCVAAVDAGRATCELTLPGPGRYGVALFHDLDGDGIFDRNLLGLPQEGWGFSRNAPTGLTGPSFGDAALTVAPGDTLPAKVRIRYAL